METSIVSSFLIHISPMLIATSPPSFPCFQNTLRQGYERHFVQGVPFIMGASPHAYIRLRQSHLPKFCVTLLKDIPGLLTAPRSTYNARSAIHSLKCRHPPQAIHHPLTCRSVLFPTLSSILHIPNIDRPLSSGRPAHSYCCTTTTTTSCLSPTTFSGVHSLASPPPSTSIATCNASLRRPRFLALATQNVDYTP